MGFENKDWDAKIETLLKTCDIESPWAEAFKNGFAGQYLAPDTLQEQLEEQRIQVRALQAQLVDRERAEKKATAAMRRFVKYCMALIRRSNHTDLCPAGKTLTGDCDCGLARVTAELSAEASHIVFEAMERQNAVGTTANKKVA